MHKRIKRLLQAALIVILAVCLTNVILKRVDIAKTNAEIDAIKEEIRLQKRKNAEADDILSEENIEDFYQDLAEDNLGYGQSHEKVYKSVPAH